MAASGRWRHRQSGGDRPPRGAELGLCPVFLAAGYLHDLSISVVDEERGGIGGTALGVADQPLECLAALDAEPVLALVGVSADDLEPTATGVLADLVRVVRGRILLMPGRHPDVRGGGPECILPLAVRDRRRYAPPGIQTGGRDSLRRQIEPGRARSDTARRMSATILAAAVGCRGRFALDFRWIRRLEPFQPQDVVAAFAAVDRIGQSFHPRRGKPIVGSIHIVPEVTACGSKKLATQLGEQLLRPTD